MLHLELILRVAYDKDGTTTQELVDMLRSVADSAASNGLFTGETPAVVDGWSAEVKVVSEE